jgi:accessory colonization factor AcfC
MTGVLARVYRILPTIQCWIEHAPHTQLWQDWEAAKQDLGRMVGAHADERIYDSLHISPEDRKFLRSPEAFEAIMNAVAAALGV